MSLTDIPHLNIIHVFPVNDLQPHETDGGICWCHPLIDLDEGMIIHNAMDGREQYETGERKPS